MRTVGPEVQYGQIITWCLYGGNVACYAALALRATRARA